uniref:Uncharacterized protein n=1 Tax=Cynoglossus semilaevis TaxID=244447 RepID=A0A3P8VFE6_CYNSE
MGNSSSDRTSGGQPGGKEARSNILIDSSEDADLFQREDSKEGRRPPSTRVSSCWLRSSGRGVYSTCGESHRL